MTIAVSLLGLAVTACAATPSEPTPSTSGITPVTVMIVGSFHMADPAHDLHDSTVEDVLQPAPQRELARWLNAPTQIRHGHEFDPGLLHVGAGTDQPGAALLTARTHRNLLICADLIQNTVAGDRVVVFYGAGHAFLLRQRVTETPGFVLVEPIDYLPRSGEAK